MTRSYPRYAGKVSGTRPMTPKDLCEVCTMPAIGWIEVQWTWSRSDDEHYKVCDEHRKLFRTDTERLARVVEDNRRKALRELTQTQPTEPT